MGDIQDVALHVGDITIVLPEIEVTPVLPWAITTIWLDVMPFRAKRTTLATQERIDDVHVIIPYLGLQTCAIP